MMPGPPPTALPLPDARRDLFAALVDDATLLTVDPPPLPAAVSGYRTARSGPAGTMLGHFVCPTPRLVDLAAVLSSTMTAAEAPWPITAVLTGDLGAAATAMQSFGAVMDPAAHIALGTRPTPLSAGAAVLEETTAAAVRATTALPRAVAALLDLAGDEARHAPAIARFIAVCHQTETPFVAAGIHGVVTEHGKPGILNLVTATALAGAGATAATVVAALEETDSAIFELSRTALIWRNHTIGAPTLRHLRITALQSVAATHPERVLADMSDT